MSDEILVIESKLDMKALILPVKMTLVKVRKGVVLISPLPDIEKFKDQIDSFGVITDVVSPNLFHHFGAGPAQKLFPKAKFWGVEGIEEKAPYVKWDEKINDDNWPYESLKVLSIKGMPKMNEVDFFHEPSKTLVVSDLCFNLTRGGGVGFWILTHLFGTYKRLAVSKVFTFLIKNKKECSGALAKIMELDFEKVIIPHGENLTVNAKKRLGEALKERKLL